MSKEVLIVDDDRTLVRSLERAIRDEGYPTRTAHDGESALREIRRETPGLVLLDLLIPARDGRAVLRALRESDETADLPVVAMSGIFRGRSHATELAEAGAQAFLEKPFRRAQLLGLLRRHLGRPPRKGEQADEAPGGADRVSLADQPVAALIWQAIQEKRTGALAFESGRRRKTLVVRAGRPTQIGSNVARETLGNRLFAAGQIDERALQESLRRARAGEGRQGEILVKLGVVTQGDVDRALRAQAEEKLLDLFSWNEGQLVFHADVAEAPRSSSLEDWTPRELILRGVQLMSPQRVEQLLGPHREELIARTKLDLQPSEAALPAVAAVLRELEGGEVTVARIAADYGPVLYGLHLVGAVRFGDEPEVGPEPRERPPGLATEEELRERLGTQAELDHFQTLGVPQNAPDGIIRQAFLSLAKRFHPDRYTGLASAERELAAQVFARIAEAHQVLSEPKTRQAYLQALQSGNRDVDPRQVTQIVRAETLFQKGEALFKKRAYAEALEQFREALELNPEEGDFHAYYGWTYFLSRREDPNAERTARDRLQQALERAPNSAGAHYLAGLLQKACGDPQAAERMFKKALQLAPGHVEAGRELRLLNLRKDRTGEKGRGIFGLGRKKG